MSFLSRIGALALTAGLLSGTLACVHVVPPPESSTHRVSGGSVWVSSLFWGILEEDANIECPQGGLAEVHTTVLVPVSVATLGIWTPSRVSVMCELPRRTLADVTDGK